MAATFLTAFVLSIFVLVVLQARHRITHPLARRYKVGRRMVKTELTTLDSSRPVLNCDVQGYRWRPRGPNDQMDWLGRLDATESDVYLRPSLVWAPLLGIPCFIPSYRIPRAEITRITVAEDDRPSRMFRLLGKRSRHQLAISTRSGATCLVDLSATSDAADIVKALSP